MPPSIKDYEKWQKKRDKEAAEAAAQARPAPTPSGQEEPRDGPSRAPSTAQNRDMPTAIPRVSSRTMATNRHVDAPVIDLTGNDDDEEEEDIPDADTLPEWSFAAITPQEQQQENRDAPESNRPLDASGSDRATAQDTRPLSERRAAETGGGETGTSKHTPDEIMQAERLLHAFQPRWNED